MPSGPPKWSRTMVVSGKARARSVSSGNLRMEQPGVEAQARAAPAARSPRGRWRRSSRCSVGLLCELRICSLACQPAAWRMPRKRPRAGVDVRFEHLAHRGAQAQVGEGDDARGHARGAVAAAGAHGRDAVDELGLAHRAQRARGRRRGTSTHIRRTPCCARRGTRRGHRPGRCRRAARRAGSGCRGGPTGGGAGRRSAAPGSMTSSAGAIMAAFVVAWCVRGGAATAAPAARPGRCRWRRRPGRSIRRNGWAPAAAAARSRRRRPAAPAARPAVRRASCASRSTAHTASAAKAATWLSLSQPRSICRGGTGISASTATSAASSSQRPAPGRGLTGMRAIGHGPRV